MGKRVILAADGPGFLVNRCGRPFYTEALRLLQERIATHEQIDRICRLGGGFRMGPFELMDMVGIDVGFEVAKSFNELSFGEPRWKPNPIQERMARGGRHGRKSGRGYYDYSAGRAPAARPRPARAGRRREPRDHDRGQRPRCGRAGGAGTGRGLRGAHRSRATPSRSARWACPPCSSAPTAACARWTTPAPSASTWCLPSSPLSLVELTGERNEQVDLHWNRLGFHTEWVEDAPGLVLGRIVAQLVNEAMFAVGEGVGTPDDVDAGLELGLNHPRGPVGWGRTIGFDRVLAAIDGIWPSAATSATAPPRSWCAAGREPPRRRRTPPLVPRHGAAGRGRHPRRGRPARPAAAAAAARTTCRASPSSTWARGTASSRSSASAGERSAWSPRTGSPGTRRRAARRSRSSWRGPRSARASRTSRSASRTSAPSASAPSTSSCSRECSTTCATRSGRWRRSRA